MRLCVWRSACKAQGPCPRRVACHVSRTIRCGVESLTSAAPRLRAHVGFEASVLLALEAQAEAARELKDLVAASIAASNAPPKRRNMSKASVALYEAALLQARMEIRLMETTFGEKACTPFSWRRAGRGGGLRGEEEATPDQIKHFMTQLNRTDVRAEDVRKSLSLTLRIDEVDPATGLKSRYVVNGHTDFVVVDRAAVPKSPSALMLTCLAIDVKTQESFTGDVEAQMILQLLSLQDKLQRSVPVPVVVTDMSTGMRIWMVSGSRVDDIRSATGGVLSLREGMGVIHALLDVQVKAIAERSAELTRTPLLPHSEEPDDSDTEDRAADEFGGGGAATISAPPADGSRGGSSGGGGGGSDVGGGSSSSLRGGGKGGRSRITAGLPSDDLGQLYFEAEAACFAARRHKPALILRGPLRDLLSSVINRGNF